MALRVLRERSLGLKRGAQVPHQREQPRPDVALEQFGAELEGGPAAADDEGLGSVAGVERRRHGVDVAAPLAQGEAEAVLLVVAEGLLEAPPGERPVRRTAQADLLPA